MSFSSDTKNELVKVRNVSTAAAVCELMGAVAFGGRLRRDNGVFKVLTITENPKVARRIFQLMKDSASVVSKIKIHKTNKNNIFYHVYAENEDAVSLLINLGFIVKPSDINYLTTLRVNTEYIDKPAKMKAFLRGAFLTSGAVMSPDKKYHMEFATSSYGLHNDLFTVMKALGLKPRIVVRSGNMVIYFKNSEEIADILTLMGAYKVLMDFHNAKIIKEIRNNVNRTMNCEAANLQKMVDASMEQVAAINKLIEKNKFDTLPDNLKEVARLRLEYREHSLKELGEMLDPPLGKSGVNHRLRKIQEIAEKC
ncbi:MAG: DNA-binding protein WhiA [Clostridia bacterium]|nr:DNA-binding protein WhiA [Clostridia bacterium]